MDEFKIRCFQQRDFEAWVRMRLALWPSIALEDGDLEARRWLEREDAVVILAEDAGGRLVGFAEAGERAYADGCSTAPVAFLEGWWVEPEVRRRGIGRALAEAVAAWARERGYAEFASDALLENVASHRAHAALGFTEVQRSVQFCRVL